MYKMQLVNQSNLEVLIEYSHSDTQFIQKFIDICTETLGQECYIFDSHHRIYSGQYLSCAIIRTEIEKVYQLFFNAKLSSNILA